MNRKLLLLMLFVCIAGSSFASTLVQGNWRWRNNDGDENAATFKAAENASIVISDLSTIRLRVRVENTDATETHSVGTLRYATSAAGPFVEVGVGENAAFVYDAASGAPAAKSPTTRSDFLTTTTGTSTYSAGQYFTAARDLSDNADKAPILAGKSSDLEFVIKPTAKIQTSTTYYFLIENESSSGSHNLARLSTAATLPVDFVSFEAKPNKNRVQLKWTTASETNNDRFEIARSTNAKDWQFLAKEKGSGSTNTTSTYSSVDYKPFNGISYYQLTQFDLDGTKKVLATRSVNLTLDPAVDVQVYPNPAVNAINVTLNNYAGKDAEVKLYGQDGKLVHTQGIKNDGQPQKLNMRSMPSAGVYVIKVVGDGLSASKKLVVL